MRITRVETTGERSRNSDDIRCFGVCDDFAWKMNLTIDAALTLSLNPVLKGLCGVGRVGLSSRFGMQMIVAKESSSCGYMAGAQKSPSLAHNLSATL